VILRARPPVASVLSFIDCINRGDLAGLGRLMTDDHQLKVFDQPPLAARVADVDAWQGYFASFPEYVIYPRLVAELDGRVAVLGHTTGSHLGLADEVERRLPLIWVAEVAQGCLRCWELVEDSEESRGQLGLDRA